MTRSLLLLLCLPALCPAQIVVMNHATGAILSSPLQLPDVGVNDYEQEQIDIANVGDQDVTVGSVSATGLYFSLCCESAFILPAHQSHTLTLQFAPTGTGNFTGALIADQLTIYLFARALAAVSLFVPTASGLLQAHAGIPFTFTLDAGSPDRLSCVLRNDSAGPVVLSSLTLSGDWTFASPPDVPFVLQAGAQAPLTLLRFAPPSQVELHGVIGLNQWSYALNGHPVQPKVQLKLSSALLQSAEQDTVSVVFDSPPSIAQGGTLTLSLEPLTGVAITDPAVLFTSSGSASISFMSVPGQTTAAFSGQPSATFQTGTTTGVLHFDAKWGDSEDKQSVGIQPALIGIETVTAQRGSSELEVTVVGFDNTRTAGRMSFSFFDNQGAFIGNPVSADFTETFYNYFFTTADNVGGMFKLVAHFPVTGDASIVKAVQVGLMNSAGDAQASPTKFQ